MTAMSTTLKQAIDPNGRLKFEFINDNWPEIVRAAAVNDPGRPGGAASENAAELLGFLTRNAITLNTEGYGEWGKEFRRTITSDDATEAYAELANEAGKDLTVSILTELTRFANSTDLRSSEAADTLLEYIEATYPGTVVGSQNGTIGQIEYRYGKVWINIEPVPPDAPTEANEDGELEALADSSPEPANAAADQELDDLADETTSDTDPASETGDPPNEADPLLDPE
ncbi:MAG TPA: hypothetical protein VK034_17575 [Enhygromyxa sp.]|nr:hypothetical protein [Enhygromyxa sp.]